MFFGNLLGKASIYERIDVRDGIGRVEGDRGRLVLDGKKSQGSHLGAVVILFAGMGLGYHKR